MPEDIKTKTFTGTFDMPFDVPIVLREMGDRIAFELRLETDEFLSLLAKTPESDDFRMLHSDHTWVAYSTKLDENQIAIRAIGANPLLALKELRKKLGYED